MGKIIFVRHGEPDDFDKDGERLGNMNSLLTERGQSEARLAGDVIKSLYNPKHLISSTSPRAYQTAQIINKQIGKNVEIKEIGIDEEMAADVLPIPPKMPQETIDKAIATLPEAYAEAKRTIEALKSKKLDGDVIHTTHSQRMTMIHWTLLHDREPTSKEYFAFWKNYKDDLEKPQLQHPNTRFCKMFAVDFSKKPGQQIEYPYSLYN